MKNLHRSLLVATALVVGATTYTFAEDAKPPGGGPGAGGRPGGGPGGPGGPGGRMNPEERIKMMKENLGLTDEQANKIKAILEKNRAENQEKAKAIREDKSLSEEDKRAKMRELMQGANAEIKDVLTPEQQAKWKEQMEKRRAEGGGRRPGGPGAPGGAGAEKK